MAQGLRSFNLIGSSLKRPDYSRERHYMIKKAIPEVELGLMKN